jgi:hypothetical protein
MDRTRVSILWNNLSVKPCSYCFPFSRLDLTAPTAFLGERKLIKEGDVAKAKSGRNLQVVLCNDILVLIESKNLYRMVCRSSQHRETSYYC